MGATAVTPTNVQTQRTTRATTRKRRRPTWFTASATRHLARLCRRRPSGYHRPSARSWLATTGHSSTSRVRPKEIWRINCTSDSSRKFPAPTLVEGPELEFGQAHRVHHLRGVAAVVAFLAMFKTKKK